MAAGYTDAEKAAYVELAAEIGLAPAARELGYPAADKTQAAWMKAHGVTAPAVDEKKREAVERREWFRTEEQHAAASAALDMITGWLTEPQTVAKVDREGNVHAVQVVPTPREVLDLTKALASAVQTLRLITGKTTAEVGVEVRDLAQCEPEVVELIRSATDRVAELAATG